MSPVRRAFGVTIVEVLCAVAALAMLAAVALPALAGVTCDELKNVSISNLQALNVAHALYAADWNGRQVTWARDDLGAFGGDPAEYNAAHGCLDPFDPGCQPPVVAGEDCDGTLHGYFSPAQSWAVQPINFPGPPEQNQGVVGRGAFRFPNARPFHEYLSGRVQDPVFYAPKDVTVIADVEECLDSTCEFDPACGPGWSSYCLSPAAMFHPDVLSFNDAIEVYWRPPWEFAEGYESPTVSQATYPALKTRMLEHSWLQDPAEPCNNAFAGCEPYYFNHSFHSVPMTLFFDGHVTGLSPFEALRSEDRIQDQTGLGLWSRDTPFGSTGYFTSVAYDYASTSYHVLTVDGIRGRDTVFGGEGP